MEQYKLINAELMDQVQSQRRIIGKLQEAEVELKKQWMEERERRLADAEHNEIKLKAAIMTLLQTLDLHLDISSNNVSSRMSQLSANRTNRLSANQICSEFRRSSTLMQRRITLSPSRNARSTSSNTKKSPMNNLEKMDEAAETITKTPEPRRLAELQCNISSPGSPNSLEIEETQTPLPNIAGGQMCSIIEESDIEDLMSSSSISSENTLEQPVEVYSKTLSESIGLENTKGKCVIGNSKETTSVPFHDVQLYSPPTSPRPSNDDCTCEIQSFSINAPHDKPSASAALENKSPQRTENLKKLMNCGQCSLELDSQEPIIYQVRAAPRRNSPVDSAVPCTSLNMVTSITPRRSHMNFINFNCNLNQSTNASTPRGRQDTLVVNFPEVSAKGKVTRTTTIEDSRLFQQSNSDSTRTTRLSRSCRPKSLKEPNINRKMRNESSSKPK